MSVQLRQLALAAALAHCAPDADMALHGPGRRWLVGFRRPGATIDPCGFRQLVLAAMRGCRVGLLPIERVDFVGGLRDIGGGIYQRQGDLGTERRIATPLPAEHVEAILAADLTDVGDTMTAHVQGDDELGATVVTIATASPVFDHHVDVVALRVAAACFVEELISSADREPRP